LTSGHVDLDDHSDTGNNTVELAKAMEFAETVRSVWTDDSCIECNAMREFFIFQIAAGLFERLPCLKFGF